MRILFLSFYYEPDLSAGSFRSTALVNALGKRLGKYAYIDVLTSQPNRYQSFNCDAQSIESMLDIRIIRFRLPRHHSGFFDQSRSFAAFAWEVIRFIRKERYDIVYATSSRLMTAFLGALISRWKSIPLFLDIRDIFVDTMQDVLPNSLARIVLPAFRHIEAFTMRQASRINLVSEGFRSYFVARYPDKIYGFVPNGIDEEFVDVDFTPEQKKERDLCIVLYAGNIGEGQGLDRIIPGLANRTQDTHEFWIVGDGGARGRLETATAGMNNVKIIPPVARNELLSLYRRSDVLFLHLNDYPAFRRVLPSKIFEYVATGKPVIAGVSGYASEFLRSIPGVAVFSPCDIISGCVALESIPKKIQDRRNFIERYKRDRLMENLAEDIVSLNEGAQGGD